jgi:hypothetical protein
VDRGGDEIMRRPNSYCHSALGVSNYLSTDPDWYQEWWNYVTALRGYDDDSDERSGVTKGLLTCVLRGKGSVIHDRQILVAWDITHALDVEGYFNVFDDIDEQDSLIEYLEYSELEHYRHHVAMGFDALSFYYKRLYDQSGDDIHFLCGDATRKIYDSITAYHERVSADVFDNIYDFLKLVSEVE